MFHLFLEFTLANWYIWVILLFISVVSVLVDAKSEVYFAIIGGFTRGFIVSPQENSRAKLLKRSIFNSFLYFSLFMVVSLILATFAKLLAPYW
jgi:hypothetical protein